MKILLYTVLALSILVQAPTQAYSERKKAKLNLCSKNTPRNQRPKCCDGRDNDKDGYKDYPKDLGCLSKTDKSEKGKERTLNPDFTPTPSAPNNDIQEGVGSSLKGKRIFPQDSPWNQDVSALPVDPNSDNLIASIGLETGLHPDFGTFWEDAPIGFPYVVVSGKQAKIPMSFYYPDESDPGPYPIPQDVPIEGGNNSSGDRHIIIIDKDNWKLYETFDSHKSDNGWSCGSGAVYDLNSNQLRPAGWTSADAAGLPIFPALVRYDEVVELGEITHALRFTVANSRKGYISPARHYASSNTSINLPPMGMRVRLKASVDISSYPKNVQTILIALKKYGMFVADNGSNWFISGAHDTRWNDDELGKIRGIKGRDFEVIQMAEIITN